MRSQAVLSEAILRRANLAVAALGGSLGLVAAGLGIGLVLAKGASGAAARDLTAATERGRAAEATLARGKSTPVRRLPARLDQQVESFASAFAASCRAEGVEFLTFASEGEIGAFATRYGLPTEGADWKAAEARVTIRGELADIITVLAKLKRQPIPFEVVTGTIGSESAA